ncbi:hypothetical protein PoB_004777900 [Plakobranchus ocellatus]|uniref:Uncharacterized protein n=1 Tax=Plakobranchus ocellatus TaxID=259542 RepID=A0AAV4BMA3_9GAST|nr:hypothetical protein PoB_004777900 [Plakobranchus ocellatus]
MVLKKTPSAFSAFVSMRKKRRRRRRKRRWRRKKKWVFTHNISHEMNFCRQSHARRVFLTARAEFLGYIERASLMADDYRQY